jgi:hypothetical protein
MDSEISSFSGVVVETDHYEEVSGLTANGSGSTWTDVHREAWIRPCRGAERRFTFTNACFPARKGHRVTVLLGNGRPLAVINYSTEQCVNLVTPRQFELFGAAEAFGFAALLVAAGLIGLAGLVWLFIGSSAYGLVKWIARQKRYRETAASIETRICRCIVHPPAALA